MERTWSLQHQHDQRPYNLVRQDNEIEVADPEEDEDKPHVRALRSGFAGIAIDLNHATISTPPTLRLNTINSTEKEKLHASNLLEPWLAGVWGASQVDDVYAQQLRDLLIFGRGWSSFWVLPRLWADADYRLLVEDFVSAVHTGKRAKIRAAEDALEEYKQSNFPLRWQYAEARTTWAQLSRERYLPEVIELRTGTVADILADYGEAAIPKRWRPKDCKPPSP